MKTYTIIQFALNALLCGSTGSYAMAAFWLACLFATITVGDDIALAVKVVVRRYVRGGRRISAKALFVRALTWDMLAD